MLGSRALASLIPGCSNFSIQYNYACASIAVAIMLTHNDGPAEHGLKRDYPEPAWAKDMLFAVVFIGSVVGMLTMGYLGSAIGCNRALVITNSFIVGGAFVSAALSWGTVESIWEIIALSRFVLGIGVGGLYPLSAAKAAESAGANDRDEAVASAGRAFFWQGPGSMTPYVIAALLLQLPHVDGITSIQFRVLLGMGSLPALVVLLASISDASVITDSVEQPVRPVRDDGGAGTLRLALSRREHWHALAGTAGTWFLFDIAFYGTVIFSPSILKEIFGSHQSVLTVALEGALMGGIATLSTAAGLAALPYVGPKNLNIIGLGLSSVLFGFFALTRARYGEYHKTLFAQLCCVMMTLYAGPNVATFVLPVKAFPDEVRSVFHGLSAAAAKVGAMVGTLMFPLVKRRFGGVESVMIVQSLLCMAGALLSACCLTGDLSYQNIAEHRTEAVELGRGADAS